MNALEAAAHTILAPTKYGNQLSASMRLVALVIMLWHKEHEALTGGRRSMDLDFLVERTGLSVEHLEATIIRLESVNLVRRYADGWRVTFDEFLTTARAHWNYRQCVRTLT